MSIEGNNYSTGRDQASKQVADSAKNVVDDAKRSAEQAKTRAKQEASQRIDQGRTRAADELDTLAHAADAAAADLRDQDRDSLSNIVGEMAHGISNFAESLRGKSADELIHQANDLARRNPAIFLAGSIAIGLGIARFAKVAKQTSSDEGASASSYPRDSDSGYSGSSMGSSAYSDNDYSTRSQRETNYSQPNYGGSPYSSNASGSSASGSSSSSQDDYTRESGEEGYESYGERSTSPTLDDTVPRSYPSSAEASTLADKSLADSDEGNSPNNRPRQDSDFP